VTPTSVEEAGTFSIAGDTITLMPASGPAHSAQYCVARNGLHLTKLGARAELGDNWVTEFVATRRAAGAP
jgi:hypothetical protein